MGRFLFFWILLSSINVLKAQNLNFAQHSLKDHVSGMVCINSKSFYIERKQWGSSFSDSLNLVGLDENGNIVLKKKLTTMSSNYLWPGKLARTNDEMLACIYQTQNSCDVIGGYSVFRKLDTLGNTLFSVTVSTASTHYNYLVDFVQHPDSSYYLISANAIHHYSKAGAFIAKHDMNNTGLKAIAVLNNGNLFLNANNMNYELSPVFSTLQAVSSNTIMKKLMQVPSGRIYALSTAGLIWRYDSSLNPMYGVGYGTYNCSDFIARNDSVYYVGYSIINGEPFYSILDSALFQIYYTSNSLKGIYPQALDLDNKNRIHVIARAHNSNTEFHNSFSSKMNFRTYFKFPKTGNYMLQQDVGVISIKLLSPYFSMVDYSGEFEVEIKNFGNDTIKGFNLNSEKFTLICDQIWQKWYNQTIPPGATLKVNTGLIGLVGSGHYSISLLKLCFYTSTPDRQADSHPENDWLCDTIQISGVNVEELNHRDWNTLIFPNPFTSAFTIQSEFEIEEIKVFNAMGILVRRETSLGKEAVLELQELNPGIYFVRIETEKGAVTKKVVKN